VDVVATTVLLPAPRALRTAGAGRATVAAVRSVDVALVYAALVAAATLALAAMPTEASDDLLDHLSTSVANLGRAPLFVLVASAFVVSSPLQLLLLGPVVAVYGEVQRRFGRRAVLGVALLGHAGATLLVASALALGIDAGRLSTSLAHATDDVGVSYGLLAAAGLLAAQLPPRWRARGTAAVTAGLLVVLGVDATYTDVGHLLAWGLGLAAARAVASAGGTADPR